MSQKSEIIGSPIRLLQRGIVVCILGGVKCRYLLTIKEIVKKRTKGMKWKRRKKNHSAK
jgi:hypothetical protein